jgi:hypothetical protein
MATKFDARQSILHPAVTMIGTGTQNALDTLFSQTDIEMGKLFEDRNMLLSDGGNIAFTGTQINFSANLNLVLLQRQSGAVPTTISLGSSSVVLNNGDIFIGILNRSSNTVTTSTILSGSSLPAAAFANQEVFFIAARIDSTDGTKRVVFRDGTTLNAGQTARLGNSGSGGSGGVNYFSKDGAATPASHNGDFESGAISPWTLFTTTYVSSVPTTITAGAANLTATVVTTNPLAGTYTGQLTKASANAQGQGFISDVITISREDLAKVLYGKFSYEVVSGTFDASGTSTQSVEVWIYNVNAATWTQVPGYRGMNQNTGPAKSTFSFQTDYLAANNQYRVALIINSTSTSPFVLNVDDFQLAPGAILTGPIVTDWVFYTPTFAGFGTVSTSNFWWRRNGPNLEIKGNFNAGTATATTASISMPASIDTGKINNNQSIGTAETTNVGSTFFKIAPIYSSSVGANFIAFTTQTSTLATYGSGAVPGNQVVTTGGTQAVNVSIVTPVAGWSSNTELSSETDTRVVAMRSFASTGTSMGTLTGGFATITWNTVASDTHGAYNSSTGIYTAPISGYYDISSGFESTATYSAIQQQTVLNIMVDSTITSQGQYLSASSGTLVSVISANIKSVFLRAGQTISVQGATTGTSAAYVSNTAANFLSISRQSGPSIVAASETVSCKATSSSSTVSTASNAIIYPTVAFDSHGGYNATTGIYTVPVSGKYRITSMTYGPAAITTSSAASDNVFSFVTVNGSSQGLHANLAFPGPVASQVLGMNGTSTHNLKAGDQVQIFVGRGTNVSSFSLSGDLNTYFCIDKVGN